MIEPATRLRRILPVAILAALVLSGPASALDLALPDGATIVAATPPEAGVHSIATGLWDGSTVPTTEVSGTVRSAAWQVPASPDISLGSVSEAIERQLRDQGYTIALKCADRSCGGFDFRQRLNMGQSPEMHVDIGNFRYLSATGESEGEAVAVTVSLGGQTVYVHVVHVGATAQDGPWVTPSTRTPVTVEDPAPAIPATTTPQMTPSEAISRLSELGAVSLDDLRFGTGASELSGNDYPSLVALAAFLAENPARRVVLVGHTDAEGSRDGNIALSRARADAVRRHLIDSMGVDPTQLDATGIGYLAPRATNETADGREANRRVEVVLLDAG